MKNATRPSEASAPLIKYNQKRMKLHDKATRRQQKHDMLLTFMAQAHPAKAKRTPARRSFFSSLLSIFL